MITECNEIISDGAAVNRMKAAMQILKENLHW